MVLEAQFLLYTLNEYLSHTAVLVQPLQAGPDWAEDVPLYSCVDIPLPMFPSTPASVTGAAPSVLCVCPSGVYAYFPQRWSRDVMACDHPWKPQVARCWCSGNSQGHLQGRAARAALGACLGETNAAHRAVSRLGCHQQGPSRLQRGPGAGHGCRPWTKPRVGRCCSHCSAAWSAVLAIGGWEGRKLQGAVQGSGLGG